MMHQVVNAYLLAAAPPALAFTDVKLLCGFEGSDGSTTFTDESSIGRTLTTGTAAQIDTAQAKFGSSSLLLDGSFDVVSAPNSADFVFDGPFCAEAWIRIAGSTGNEMPIFFFGTTGLDWELRLDSDFKLRGRFTNAAGTATSLVEAAASMTTATWYHVAMDRDASNMGRAYINGVVVAGPTSMTGTGRNLGGLMRIGRTQSSANAFNGWIDEARIIKGATPYGGAFTPPAAAFPRS